MHQPEFISMAKAANEFLDSYIRSKPKYKDFPESMEEVLRRAKMRQKCVVLSPHWFLPFDSETYVEIIKKELKWKFPRLSYPAKTTNCYLNFLAVYLSMKHYGYTHYHVEMSKMIRLGMLTREEAQDMLKINFDQTILESVLKKFAARHEYFFKQLFFEGAIKDQRERARYMMDGLKDVNGISFVKESDGDVATYPFLTAIFDSTERRDKALTALRVAGLGASITYLRAITNFDYLRAIVPPEASPGGDAMASKAMTLSTSCYLDRKELNVLINMLKEDLKC